MYYDPYKRSESISAYKNRINSIDSTIIAYLISPCKRIFFNLHGYFAKTIALLYNIG